MNPRQWSFLLGGILVIGAFVMSLRADDSTTKPSAQSTEPSGTAALVRLLRSRGYPVRIDTRSSPRLGANDVAVSFAVFNDDNSKRENEGLEKVFKKFFAQGGTEVLLYVPAEYRQASRSFRTTDPARVAPRHRGVARTIRIQNYAPSDLGPDAIALWSESTEAYVAAKTVGPGLQVLVGDGIPLTNRFLPLDDAAEFALDLLGPLHRSGGEFVFVDAVAGNVRDPALLEILGPGAVTAWYQGIFAFLVIVVSLGKPFGLPDPERRGQRGARELMDALSGSFRRGRHYKTALRTIVEATEDSIRRSLRLSNQDAIPEKDPRVPEELDTALRRARFELERADLPEAQLASAARLLIRARSLLRRRR